MGLRLVRPGAGVGVTPDRRIVGWAWVESTVARVSATGYCRETV